MLTGRGVANPRASGSGVANPSAESAPLASGSGMATGSEVANPRACPHRDIRLALGSTVSMPFRDIRLAESGGSRLAGSGVANPIASSAPATLAPGTGAATHPIWFPPSTRPMPEGQFGIFFGRHRPTDEYIFALQNGKSRRRGRWDKEDAEEEEEMDEAEAAG